jgi:arylsulfatase
VCLRLPKLFNLRMDPYERADITSDQYNDWLVKNVYLNAIATMKASAFLQTFVAYPPSQRPASFSVDGVRRQVDKKIDESFKKRGLE